MARHNTESFLPLKPEVFEVLLALAEGDQHGYAILKVLENRGLRVAASLLYRKLHRLMDEGLVAESSRRPKADNDDARRRYYRLTALGHAVVRGESVRVLGLARNPQVQRLASSAGGSRA